MSADNTTACTLNFALQAINCEIIIGKISDPITVLLRETSTIMTNNRLSVLITQSSIDNTNQNHAYTAALALACMFAIGLITSIAALVTMAAFVYQSRSRVAKRQTSHELATTTAATELPESDYEIIMQSLEHINTNDNVAYDPVTVVK